MAAEPVLDAASVDALLEEFTTLHQRIVRGLALLLARASEAPDPAWERAADERFQRLRRQHQDIGRAVETTIPRADLTRRRDVLLRKLSKGWLMDFGSGEEREEMEERFATYLARYEAVDDALHGLGWVETELARRLALVMAARAARTREERG